MINDVVDGIFTLTCDYCNEECDEAFETFHEAVEYKKDRDNRWASIKNKDGEWVELCPTCNCPEVIAKLKGIARNEISRQHGAELARLAAADIEEEE